MKGKLKRIGEFLTFLSTLIFTISIPTSMALDNVGAAVGILGFLILAVAKIDLEVPVKPLLLFAVPELISSAFNPELLKNPFKYTDINHHLISYFSSFKTFLKRENYKLFIILSASTIVSSLAVIVEAFTHQRIKHFNFSNFHIFTEPIRAEGLLNHPLTTAGVLYLLFILFTFLTFHERKKLYGITAVFTLAALIFTESRSYWLGTALFFLSLIAYGLKVYKRFAVYGLIVSVLTAIAISTVPPLKHRFESIKNVKTNTSNMDRLTIWNAYFKALKEDYSVKELLFGAGGKREKLAFKHFDESFKEVYHQNPTPSSITHFHGGETHNIYLKFLTKYGILGFIGYISFFVYLIYLNFKHHKLLPYLPILSFGYLGFMTAGFFENNFTDAEVQFALFFLLGFDLSLIKLHSPNR